MEELLAGVTVKMNMLFFFLKFFFHALKFLDWIKRIITFLFFLNTWLIINVNNLSDPVVQLPIQLFVGFISNCCCPEELFQHLIIVDHLCHHEEYMFAYSFPFLIVWTWAFENFAYVDHIHDSSFLDKSKITPRTSTIHRSALRVAVFKNMLSYLLLIILIVFRF